MTIQRIWQPGPLLDAIYGDLLVPAFPVDELISPERLGQDVSSGGTEVLLGRDSMGTPVAAAIGEWFADARVMLLSYLVVGAAGRGQGLGGKLLHHALKRWRGTHQPALILAEIERPDRHVGDSASGNPKARLRFYERLGAQALDLPYFQPRLDPSTSPVYGMLLITLHIDHTARGSEPDSVDPAPLSAFLADYLDEPGSPPSRRLAAAAARTEGVPLLPLAAYHRIPTAEPPRVDG